MIFAFSTAVVAVTEEAELEVIVGTVIQVLVVKLVSLPVPVPAVFTAKAR